MERKIGEIMGMTKTDVLIATHKAYHFLNKVMANNEIKAKETMVLISKMHNKIENAYTIVFALEKTDDHFKEIGEVLRKALESETLVQ